MPGLNLNLPHPDLRSSSAPGPAPRGPQSINDSIFSNYLIAATKGDHNLLTVLGAPGPELLHQVLALQVPDLAGGPGGRHLSLCQQPRAAHALCLDQNVKSYDNPFWGFSNSSKDNNKK